MKKLTRKQCNDAGLALIFILLLAAVIGERAWAVPAALASTLLVMVWPGAFRPFGVLWFGLSTLLGAVMSKVFLTIIFVFVVTPIALLRRVLNKDPMRLKDWKSGDESVFRVRDRTMKSADLEQMF